MKSETQDRILPHPRSANEFARRYPAHACQVTGMDMLRAGHDVKVLRYETHVIVNIMIFVFRRLTSCPA
jgi:hypothetical protein